MSRLSPGTLLLGVVAIMFGLLSAYVVRKNMMRETPAPVVETPPPVQTFVVPKAAANLMAGRTLTMGDVVIYRYTQEQLDAEPLPSGYMVSSEQIIGRTLKQELAEKSVFTPDMFYPEGTGPGIVQDLEPGQRAFTVRVEYDEAVEGFARPGTKVDVLFRVDADDQNELPQTTVTLLQDVKVLSFDASPSSLNPIPDPRTQRQRQTATVTLAVQPQDVIKLQVAENHGTFALALVSPEGNAVSYDGAPRTLAELLERRPPARTMMRVYRGANISELEFRENAAGREQLFRASATQDAADAAADVAVAN
ncbi:Flp pilus assembly protein CpaB [Blastopirellula sp. JC732]|uniref:Flp pilus assembly protein CpaB n=1 Tax=Blastopirellula sediminis TaxID=2894196 RepID=A0A9X1SIX4_9BACT|nr:Flp pilus assembly protein CpaB [Blastopirellula sediminis]MCC9605429.1 Flp pilus assembly protein CpaB [Blastopirellula sediminis]MCC9631271.1 Flp pilus assembly protein CpaB [Blastopirellula sediminis]